MMEYSLVCCVAQEGRCDTSGQGQQDICNFLNINYNFFASFPSHKCVGRQPSVLALSCFLLIKIHRYSHSDSGHRGFVESWRSSFS